MREDCGLHRGPLLSPGSLDSTNELQHYRDRAMRPVLTGQFSMAIMGNWHSPNDSTCSPGTAGLDILSDHWLLYRSFAM